MDVNNGTFVTGGQSFAEWVQTHDGSQVTEKQLGPRAKGATGMELTGAINRLSEVLTPEESVLLQQSVLCRKNGKSIEFFPVVINAYKAGDKDVSEAALEDVAARIDSVMNQAPVVSRDKKESITALVTKIFAAAQNDVEHLAVGIVAAGFASYDVEKVLSGGGAKAKSLAEAKFRARPEGKAPKFPAQRVTDLENEVFKCVSPEAQKAVGRLVELSNRFDKAEKQFQGAKNEGARLRSEKELESIQTDVVEVLKELEDLGLQPEEELIGDSAIPGDTVERGVSSMVREHPFIAGAGAAFGLVGIAALAYAARNYFLAGREEEASDGES